MPGHNGPVMDIGWGELLLLGVLGLIIFGPDKLPRAAADAGRLVRRLREMADSARTNLHDAAGVEIRGVSADLRSVADLHPRKLIGTALADLAATDGHRPDSPTAPPRAPMTPPSDVAAPEPFDLDAT